MVPTAQRRRPPTGGVYVLFWLLTALLAASCTPNPAPETLPSQFSAPHVLSGVLHGRTAATLSLRDAASRVDIRLVTLSDQLYRISTPADSGLAPRVTGPPGGVRLALAPTGADGPDTVEILLNRAVRWDLRLPAGAGEQHLDLGAGTLRQMALGSGAGLVRIRLPRPVGPVPITVTGSVGDLVVSVPRATAVRLRLRGGAASVTLPGSAAAPAGPDSVMTSGGTPARRYSLDLESPAGTVIIRQR
jgi:hypothetical protein